MADLDGVSVKGLTKKISGRSNHVRQFDPREAHRLQYLKFKKPPRCSM